MEHAAMLAGDRLHVSQRRRSLCCTYLTLPILKSTTAACGIACTGIVGLSVDAMRVRRDKARGIRALGTIDDMLIATPRQRCN